MEVLNTVLHSLADYSVLFFDYAAILILIFSGLQGIVNIFRRTECARLSLAKGLALALEILICSDLIRTLLNRDLREISYTAILAAVWAVITGMIRWGMKGKEESPEKKSESAEKTVPAVVQNAAADKTVEAVKPVADKIEETADTTVADKAEEAVTEEVAEAAAAEKTAEITVESEKEVAEDAAEEKVETEEPSEESAEEVSATEESAVEVSVAEESAEERPADNAETAETTANPESTVENVETDAEKLKQRMRKNKKRR